MRSAPILLVLLLLEACAPADPPLLVDDGHQPSAQANADKDAGPPSDEASR
jgi:hypothetical protein